LADEELKPIKITWKKEEKKYCEYALEHSSPSAWAKDLIIADYKKTHEEEKEQKKQNNNNVLNFLD
jgi:hypothetical protein